MVRRLIILAQSNYVSINLGIQEGNDWQRNELQFQSIRIISVLIKFDDQWLASQQDLVQALKQIWCDDGYLVSEHLRSIYKLAIGCSDPTRAHAKR